jgi:hypothetical protein
MGTREIKEAFRAIEVENWIWNLPTRPFGPEIKIWKEDANYLATLATPHT